MSGRMKSMMVLVALVMVVVGCSSSDDGDGADAGADQPDDQVLAEDDGADQSDEDGGPLAVDPLLVELEASSGPLTDLVGRSMMDGLDPTASVNTEFATRCPNNTVDVDSLYEGSVTSDGQALDRWTLVFDTSDEAQAFTDTVAADSSGCSQEIGADDRRLVISIEDLKPFEVGEAAGIRWTETTEAAPGADAAEPVTSGWVQVVSGRAVLVAAVTQNAAGDTTGVDGLLDQIVSDGLDRLMAVEGAG